MDGGVAGEVGAVEVVDEDGEAPGLDERAGQVVRGEIGEHGRGVDHELFVDGQFVDACVIREEVLGRGARAVGREVEEFEHGVGVCEVGDRRFVVAERLADAGPLEQEQRHVFVGCRGHLAGAIEQRRELRLGSVEVAGRDGAAHVVDPAGVAGGAARE